MTNDKNELLRLKQEILETMYHHRYEIKWQESLIAQYREALNFAIQFLWGDGNPDVAAKLAIEHLNKIIGVENVK